MAGGLDHQESTEELLSAHTRLWSYTFGCIKSMSLMAAVQLGIPDAVHSHGGPISLPLLAAAVGIPGDKVPAFRRLMRALAHSGIFRRGVCKAGDEGRGAKDAEEEDIYSPTILSKQLLKDNPTSAAPFLLLALASVHVTLWYSMAAWLREEGPKPSSAFEASHGVTMFESLRTVPELSDVLYRAMACDSRWAVGLVGREHPEVFRGLTSLVDVGGGDGTTAKAIKDAFPEIRCTVLEQPHVVAASPAIDGVDFVEGDMLEHVPSADAVLLKWVMKEMEDEDCVRILRRCREAIIPAKDRGGKVIVIDTIMGVCGSGDNHEVVEVQRLFDLQMLAIMNGKERDEGEWRRLFTAAGFSTCKITPALGPRSIIEAFP